MAGKTSGLLADTPEPDQEPYIPEGSVEEVIQTLSGVLDAVFRPWVADRFTLEWLEVTDDRLGMTRFDEGSNELVRRRKLRLDPGPITIGLHPALLQDEALYKHTVCARTSPCSWSNHSLQTARQVGFTNCSRSILERIATSSKNARRCTWKSNGPIVDM